jgi:hypothetical protein
LRRAAPDRLHTQLQQTLAQGVQLSHVCAALVGVEQGPGRVLPLDEHQLGVGRELRINEGSHCPGPQETEEGLNAWIALHQRVLVEIKVTPWLTS